VATQIKVHVTIRSAGIAILIRKVTFKNLDPLLDGLSKVATINIAGMTVHKDLVRFRTSRSGRRTVFRATRLANGHRKGHQLKSSATTGTEGRTNEIGHSPGAHSLNNRQWKVRVETLRGTNRRKIGRRLTEDIQDALH
jgi:hypothetical protein